MLQLQDGFVLKGYCSNKQVPVTPSSSVVRKKFDTRRVPLIEGKSAARGTFRGVAARASALPANVPNVRMTQPQGREGAGEPMRFPVGQWCGPVTCGLEDQTALQGQRGCDGVLPL